MLASALKIRELVSRKLEIRELVLFASALKIGDHHKLKLAQVAV